jgi:hypothetical protein
MSNSFYRGKLHTNSDVKGPFTEAEDKLEGKVFKLLADAITGGADIIGETYLRAQVVRTELKPHSIIFSTGAGVSVEITEDGGFEIFEGAA